MLYVDDTHFDKSYFERCFSLFDSSPMVGGRSEEGIAVRISDPAFLIALCLYIKERGGALFPLPANAPLEAAERQATRSGCRHLLFGTEGEAALRNIQAVAPPYPPSSSGGPALIQTSSGTTGQSKTIKRSWASIDTEVESYISLFDGANSQTPIVAAPVNHSYGLISGVLSSIRRGIEPIVVRNLNPKYVLRKMTETPSAILYSSPTLITTLCMLVTEKDPLFAVMTSGTLMQKACFDVVRRKVHHLHQQYGCSEAGCVTFGQNISAPGELGVALPHIELSSGASAAEPREILVKVSGNNVIKTGDLGYLEGESLHFVSRLDDMINVSGLKVYPAEVEEVILEMPGVTDAVVFKRPHQFGHDKVALQFVANEPVSGEAVREWCARRLTSYQIPMEITQVPAIPKLQNGKISRKALAET